MCGILYTRSPINPLLAEQHCPLFAIDQHGEAQRLWNHTKSAIFRLLELPWYSPPFPVHSHYNTEPYILWNNTKSAIFKLLELPWYSPPFPVHSHYNTQTSHQFSCQSSSTCISACATPSWASRVSYCPCSGSWYSWLCLITWCWHYSWGYYIQVI